MTAKFTPKRTELYERRADIAKALAHPTRLLIIDALSAGERCVCDLNELVDIDQSTLSKHLSVLKHAGLVEVHKKGLWVHYKLRCNCILSFFDCAEGVLKVNSEESSNS